MSEREEKKRIPRKKEKRAGLYDHIENEQTKDRKKAAAAAAIEGKKSTALVSVASSACFWHMHRAKDNGS